MNVYLRGEIYEGVVTRTFAQAVQLSCRHWLCSSICDSSWQKGPYDTGLSQV